jgi:hypothetical protein
MKGILKTVNSTTSLRRAPQTTPPPLLLLPKLFLKLRIMSAQEGNQRMHLRRVGDIETTPLWRPVAAIISQPVAAPPPAVIIFISMTIRGDSKQPLPLLLFLILAPTPPRKKKPYCPQSTLHRDTLNQEEESDGGFFLRLRLLRFLRFHLLQLLQQKYQKMVEEQQMLVLHVEVKTRFVPPPPPLRPTSDDDRCPRTGTRAAVMQVILMASMMTVRARLVSTATQTMISTENRLRTQASHYLA